MRICVPYRRESRRLYIHKIFRKVIFASLRFSRWRRLESLCEATTHGHHLVAVWIAHVGGIKIG